MRTEKKNKTLSLTLKKSAFDVMESGEKMEEFRRPSKWLMARLEKKPDKVTFFDGYKKTAGHLLEISRE